MRPEDRPVANSIANLCYNLVGYFPAPVLYGLVCSATGGRRSRWGMALLMCMSAISFLFVFLAYLTTRKTVAFAPESESDEQLVEHDISGLE